MARNQSVKRAQAIVALSTMGASVLLADFSYKVTKRLTGGDVLNMRRNFGPDEWKRFFEGDGTSSAPRLPLQDGRDPIMDTYIVLVKGDLMARIRENTAQIIDLANETFIDVNITEKTYRIKTFDEEKQAWKELVQRINQGDVRFQFSVHETGETRQIDGYKAKKTVINFTSHSTDAKAEGSSVTDLWLASEILDVDECRRFESRLGEKLGIAAGPASELTGAFGLPFPKAFLESAKELSKIKGIPVLKITRIAGTTEGGNRSPELLVEETTTYTEFSSATIDAARLEIPAGFKEVTRHVRKVAPQPQGLARKIVAKLSFQLVVDCTAKSASKPMQVKAGGESVCLAEQVVADEKTSSPHRRFARPLSRGRNSKLYITYEAAARMLETTERNIGNKMGVVLNGRLVMVASIMTRISGSLRITSLNEGEIQDFVRALTEKTRSR